LMVGVKLKVPNTEFAAAARAEKLLTIPAGDNIVRLLPPLILTEDELAEGVRRLDAACQRMERDIAGMHKSVAE
jgi:acetylornithine/N-succinyldiaminopimelate aminotransferase